MRVRCQRISDVQGTGRLALGDGNDTASADTDDITPPDFYGGAGNDVLTGDPERTNLFVDGTGNDRMVGGTSIDVFDEGAGPSGSDTIVGGGTASDSPEGQRRLRLLRRSSRKDFASLDGRRNDGERGESDRIGGDVETIVGGRGRDRLLGNGRPNSLLGGRGADSINGGRGRDDIFGGSGADRISRPRRRSRHDQLREWGRQPAGRPAGPPARVRASETALSDVPGTRRRLATSPRPTNLESRAPPITCLCHVAPPAPARGCPGPGRRRLSGFQRPQQRRWGARLRGRRRGFLLLRRRRWGPAADHHPDRPRRSHQLPRASPASLLAIWASARGSEAAAGPGQNGRRRPAGRGRGSPGRSPFDAELVQDRAAALFVAIQRAWSANAIEDLRRWVGPELMVEWESRLADFRRKGWRNLVEVLDGPEVHYVGVTNRAGHSEDRAVVQLTARMRDVVVEAAARAAPRGRRGGPHQRVLDAR